MKNLFFLILSLFFITSICSQNGLLNNTIEVTYVKAYKNHRDTTSTPPKMMKNLEYHLLFNSNEARFEYIKSMTNDGDNTNSRFIGRGGGNGISYKNLKQKEKLMQTNSGDERLYLVQEDLNKYKWKLHKETKKILGYNCFKATTEYKFFHYFKNEETTLNITAWYTPRIPAPFGPAGYDGLPGLVLESHQASFYLIATDIKHHNKTKTIKRPEKGIELPEEEFNKALFKSMLKRANMTEEEWYKSIKELNKKKGW